MRTSMPLTAPRAQQGVDHLAGGPGRGITPELRWCRPVASSRVKPSALQKGLVHLHSALLQGGEHHPQGLGWKTMENFFLAPEGAGAFSLSLTSS